MRINMASVIKLILVLGVFSNAYAGGDPDFISTVLKSAHNADFKGCDKEIYNVFKLVRGSDMQVTSATTPDTAKDSLRLTVTYGDKGDVVVEEAQFRKLKKGCAVNTFTAYTVAENCGARLEASPAYKFQSEMVGVIFTETAGHTRSIFIPNGNSGCTVLHIETGLITP